MAGFEGAGEGTGFVVAHTETPYTTCSGFCDMKEAIPSEYDLITQLKRCWKKLAHRPASPVVNGLWRIVAVAGDWAGKVL